MPTRVHFPLAKILLGAAMALPAVAQEQSDPARKEAELLQGTWNFVSVEQGGIKQPRRKRGEGFQTIAFQDDKFEVKRGDLVLQAGTQQFDPGKNPKTVDLTVAAGEGKGTVRPG